jgi:hypothetical protein
VRIDNAIEAAPMLQPTNAGPPPDQTPIRRFFDIDASARSVRVRGIFFCGIGCVIALLCACSKNDALIKTTAGYPPVELKPSGLPTFAVGDSFTFDNPAETWTVTGIHDGLVAWRSSLGGARKTTFEPFMPPVEWSAPDRSSGQEQLTGWGSDLFPLKAGLKSEFRTRARRANEAAATPYEWKCYSGSPRKVTVQAGAYAAYPVFCRRNDGLTIQSFYAPEVNASLMTTQRKRPGSPDKRELIAFKLAKGPRIAATAVHGVPAGVALAAVEQAARPPQPAVTAVAAAQPPVAQAQIAQASAPPKPLASAAAPPPAASPVAPQAAKAAPAPLPVVAAPAPSRPAVAPAVARAPAPKASSPHIPRTAPSVASTPIIAAPPLIGPGPPPAAPPAVALAHAPEAGEPKAKRGRIVGGFGVQIASFRDADNVEPGWVSLRQRHTPLLNGVGHMVTPVDLGDGKGVFHRLIAGPFAARTGAEQLCRSIRARGASCLVQQVDH